MNRDLSLSKEDWALADQMKCWSLCRRHAFGVLRDAFGGDDEAEETDFLRVKFAFLEFNE